MGRVRSESWGLPGGPQVTRQTAAEGYLHTPGGGGATELWVKIELAPWFHDFSGLPDEDGDGFPEIYGRVAAEALGDPTAIAHFVRDEYEGRVLTPAEVAKWAHQLASYWYPSYNTDLWTRGRAGPRPTPSPTSVPRSRARRCRLPRSSCAANRRGEPSTTSSWWIRGTPRAPLARRQRRGMLLPPRRSPSFPPALPQPTPHRLRKPYGRSSPLTVDLGPPGPRRWLRSTRR